MSFKISYKKILLLVVLSGTIGCTNLNSFFKRGQSRGPSVKIFSEGKTYVNLEELKRKKGETRTHFDHPQYLNKDVLSNALSSIFFIEKGIMKKKEKTVFQQSELLYLAPHIADAITMASTLQYVLVHSSYIVGKECRSRWSPYH